MTAIVDIKTIRTTRVLVTLFDKTGFLKIDQWRQFMSIFIDR